MQWWFKKCWKGDKSLEDEEQRGQPLEADNGQLRGSLKLILLELQEKLLKNSALTILQSFGVWSKLERWKSSISGCLLRWMKNKKVVILMCYLLLFYTTTMNHFSNGLWCANKKWILLWQSVMTSSVVWPRRSSKAFLKAKCSPKKVHCHFLVVCCWPDPLQLSELQWNHYISEVRSANQWDTPKTALPSSQHWSTEKVQFFSRAMLNCTLHNQHFKS